MVEKKDVADQVVASIRKEQPTSGLGAFISSSAIACLVFVKENGIEIAGRGFVIYHKRTEDSVDVEVCLPVAKAGTDRGDIKFREVKGGNAASKVVKGSYEQLPAAHQEVKDWCAANSHNYTESREVFLKGLMETKNSDEFETQILYL